MIKTLTSTISKQIKKRSACTEALEITSTTWSISKPSLTVKSTQERRQKCTTKHVVLI